MKNLLLGFLLLSLAHTGFSQLRIQNCTVEHLENPLSIGTLQPRFTWQLSSDRRNVMQVAYEIKVATSPSSLLAGRNLVWQTNKTLSDSSVNVAYNGKPLQAAMRYYWTVRVWDNNGQASDWSSPNFFQVGMLQPGDWKAKWIEPAFEENNSLRPSPMLRKEFTASKKIASAFAYVTAHGMYEAHINGERVGDAYFTPGWTSYNKRLQYQVYDVTNLVKTGKNAVGVTLGNGWYRGNLAWGGLKDIYGKKLGLLWQLQVNYSDGSTDLVVSDDSWKSTTGEIVFSEIYHGETIDARLQKQGWTTAGYNDNEWSTVKVTSYPLDILVATENEPVRKHEVFNPVKIFTTPKGEKVIDFGQNLVGWVIVKASGSAGDTIRINHAEVLDKAGNFYTDNLRAARSEGNYILSGRGEEVFEPHFTFHGFRYIKVTGVKGELNPAHFTAVALYSDMKPTGTFSTSHPLINQLQHNIQWGQKGNFLDVPTDCPQRDERLGWTGDAQVFSRTASFNMDVNSFFSKWMKDVAADQTPDGSVPFVVPNVLGPKSAGSAGWADVATIVPWNMYLVYGDKRLLAEQYPSMKAWVQYMTDSSTKHLWNRGFHFGDWLFYRPDDDNDGRAALTDKYLIAQCFYAHSTQLLINAAQALGHQDDVNTYTALLQQVKSAFNREYVTPTGRLVSGSQTAYVLALHFDMLPENLRAQAAERLVQNIRSYNNHLTTGFLGTPYLCHVLSRFGYNDVAYQLLMQETYPSWLYPVKMGATTIWERWDGQKPDSTFQTPGMNSFNHYAYGAIGDWMYRQVVGLNNDGDGIGYKRIKIQPHIGGGLTNAGLTYQTRYGKVATGWKIENEKLEVQAEIPPNTSATIYIPAGSAEQVSENGRSIMGSKDFIMAGVEPGYIKVQVGSGKYSFTTNWKSGQ